MKKKTKIIRVSDDLAKALDDMAAKNGIKRVEASKIAAKMMQEAKDKKKMKLEIKF